MRVIFLQNKLLPYRIEFYNFLVCNFNWTVTVAHAGQRVEQQTILFNQVILKEKSILNFRYLSGFKREAKSYDKIVLMFDIKWLNIYSSLLSVNRKKIFLWGIGLSTKKGLKKKLLLDLFRFLLVRLSNGVILYSNYSQEHYLKFLPKSFVFCAPNSIYVPMDSSVLLHSKYNLLFVGNLHKRKRLNDLISVFKKIHNKFPILKINIIGTGEQKTSLMKMVEDANLKDKIIFHGSITEPEKLKPFYEKAIASVSLGQCGLSLLQSFGFGVPFITYENAITGGELFNLEHFKNGMLTTREKLENDLLLLLGDKELQQQLSHQAFKNYHESLSIQHMALGFKTALEK